MNKLDPSQTASAIRNAIRAKREGRSTLAEDIEALERSLIADIETFDLDAAERRAQREQADAGGGMVDPSLSFPAIAPNPEQAGQARPAAPKTVVEPPPAPLAPPDGSLLDQLRYQAENRQREQSSALAERGVANEAIDRALKRLFAFQHDFVQQLNILKPEIPRIYNLTDGLTIGPLAWQEGFADYRTQSHASGALIELASCAFRLNGPRTLVVERDGPVVERFRGLLFNFGLQFTCKEFKNARRYVERAEFLIQSELSVSARWRADFDNARIVLEMRNLERLGSVSLSLSPNAVDQALLDEFGRLILGHPNRFRELARQQ